MIEQPDDNKPRDFNSDPRLFRNAVLESAARIADEYKRREYGPHGTEWVSCEEADIIAKEIRDLKDDNGEG